MLFVLKERMTAVAERDLAVAQLKAATIKHEESLSKYRLEFANGKLELAELEQQLAQHKEKSEGADRLVAKVAELEEELAQLDCHAKACACELENMREQRQAHADKADHLAVDVDKLCEKLNANAKAHAVREEEQLKLYNAEIDKRQAKVDELKEEFAQLEIHAKANADGLAFEAVKLREEIANMREQRQVQVYNADHIAVEVDKLREELVESRRWMSRNVEEHARLCEELNAKEQAHAVREEAQRVLHNIELEARQAKINELEAIVASFGERLQKEVKHSNEDIKAAYMEREARLAAREASNKRSFEIVATAALAARDLAAHLDSVVEQAEEDDAAAAAESAPRPKRAAPENKPSPAQKRARNYVVQNESSESSESEESSESDDTDSSVVVVTKKTSAKKTPAKQAPVKQAPVKKTPAKTQQAKSSPVKKAESLEYAGGSIITGERYKQPLRYLPDHLNIACAQEKALKLVCEIVEDDGTSWFTYAAHVFNRANVPMHNAFPELCNKIPECKAWGKVANVVLPASDSSRQLIELLRGNGVEPRQAVPKSLLGKHSIKTDKNAQIVLIDSAGDKMNVGAMLKCSAQMEAVLKGHPIMAIDDFLTQLTEYNRSRGLYTPDADMPDHRASFIESMRGKGVLRHWASKPKPLMFQIMHPNPADGEAAKKQDAEPYTRNLVCAKDQPMCGYLCDKNFVTIIKSCKELCLAIGDQLSLY